MQDFDVELTNDQTGETTVVPAEAPKHTKTETPVVTTNEKQETSESKDVAETSEEASDEEDVAAKEEPEKDKLDDDLDDWAEKAGHEKPETEKERKLLQKLRNNQREFTKDRQAKKGAVQLKEAIKTEVESNPFRSGEESDPIEKRLAAVEAERISERTARLQSEFYTANAITEEVGAVMTEIFIEKVAKGTTQEAKQKIIDHWADPEQLEDLYELAKARDAGSSKKVNEDAAAQKERERIAKESKSSGVKRNAKSTLPQNQQTELEKMWAD